tara:strand:- start:101 stop:592 length:492 start_codon:yes stop_codon:yes gene_type:complete
MIPAPDRHLCISYSRTIFTSEPEGENYSEDYGWIIGGVDGDKLPLPYTPEQAKAPAEMVYTEILRIGESDASRGWPGETLSLGGVVQLIREARNEGYGVYIQCPGGSRRDGSDYEEWESLGESSDYPESVSMSVFVNGLEQWEVVVLIPLIEHRWAEIPEELD